MIMVGVNQLLRAAGFGPTLGYPGFAAAARLAGAVQCTIYDPIAEAQFAANAANDMRRIGAAGFEGLEDYAASLEKQADATPGSYVGAVELWGSLLQRVPD